MNVLCKYAVIRFMPFSETEEFANIGVLVYAPKLGTFDFKLAKTRFARVTKFFDDLDGEMYKNAVHHIKFELERIKRVSLKFSADGQMDLFNEVIRKRESIVRFGKTGTLLAETPDVALNQLFDRFIGRKFATREYRETQMVKTLRQTFDDKLSLKYKELELRAGYYPVKLPLVAQMGKSVRAIKPMSFGQTKPLALLEHGEIWINRVNRLIKSGALSREQMLFVIESPSFETVELEKAFLEVKAEMDALKVDVLSFDEENKILKFAAQDLSPESVENGFLN